MTPRASLHFGHLPDLSVRRLHATGYAPLGASLQLVIDAVPGVDFLGIRGKLGQLCELRQQLLFANRTGHVPLELRRRATSW